MSSDTRSAPGLIFITTKPLDIVFVCVRVTVQAAGLEV